MFKIITWDPLVLLSNDVDIKDPSPQASLWTSNIYVPFIVGMPDFMFMRKRGGWLKSSYLYHYLKMIQIDLKDICLHLFLEWKANWPRPGVEEWDCGRWHCPGSVSKWMWWPDVHLHHSVWGCSKQQGETFWSSFQGLQESFGIDSECEQKSFFPSLSIIRLLKHNEFWGEELLVVIPLYNI